MSEILIERLQRYQTTIEEREQVTADATRLQAELLRKEHEIQRLRAQVLDNQTSLETLRNALKEVRLPDTRRQRR